jgi:hypothetical protein
MLGTAASGLPPPLDEELDGFPLELPDVLKPELEPVLVPEPPEPPPLDPPVEPLVAVLASGDSPNPLDPGGRGWGLRSHA